MKTGIKDYSLKLNDTFYSNIQVRFNDLPVDLSAYNYAVMQVRENENQNPVLEFTSTGATNTIDISNLEAGQIIITGQTNTVEYAGQYYYDLELRNNNTYETVLTGKFLLENDYTD